MPLYPINTGGRERRLSIVPADLNPLMLLYPLSTAGRERRLPIVSGDLQLKIILNDSYHRT